MRKVRMRSRVAVVSLASLVALLLAFRWYHARLNTEDVPPPPPLNLADEGQRHLQHFRRFHKSMAQAEKEHILDGPFTVVRSTQRLPSRLQQAFTGMAGAQQVNMNNPDWTYPVTIDRVFPWRRLLFAGLAHDKEFIHYECGMSQHYYALVVFQVDDQQVQFLWGGMASDPATDLDDLRKKLAVGQFTDNLSWDW